MLFLLLLLCNVHVMVLQADAWSKLGTDVTLDWVRNGVRIPFETVPECFNIPNRHLTNKEIAFIDSEITSLLSNKAIVKCRPGDVPQCISPLSCTPKKNSKLRLVTDLRRLNDHIKSQSFRHEGIDTVTDQIQSEDYLVTIDLKNGYHHVQIHYDDRKYLGFEWRGHYYMWCVLPFGLKCSSYFFCKTVRPVIQFLRQQNIRIVSYVDDILLMCQGRDLTDHTEFTLLTLQELGFNVNFEKSRLDGSRCIEYIGFNIHTESDTPWITVPSSRIHKLKKDIRHCMKKGTIKARFLARIAGQCVSMCKAVLPGKLLLRNIYRLLSKRSAWNSMLIIDKPSLADLQWWLKALGTWNGAPLKISIPEIQIETDASSTGWGATCCGKDASGIWSSELHHMPSNYRELMAVHMSLLSFKDLIKGKVVQILSDNITTVAYLNHLGGHCLMLSDLAQAIWCTAKSINVTLCAKHLAGRLNCVADSLSRLSSQYEWMLEPGIFRVLNSMWGPFTIDRFASFLTAQLPRYNARFYDPHACGIDAMAQTDWNIENNFINPPFRMIPAILRKIQQTQATATLIAPWWPGQAWFNMLLHMTTATPFRIPNRPGTFLQWGPCIEPSKNPRWRIFAFKICGKIDSNRMVGASL